jgi:hypothetical protein
MDSSTINQWVGNIVSAGAIVGTFIGWLPGIAAFIAFVWYLIQIYESATVQRWLAARRVRKIASLKAKILVLEALNQLPALNEKSDD